MPNYPDFRLGLAVSAFLVFTFTHVQGQRSELEVHAVITRLFNGMRKGDAAIVNDVFLPNAFMSSLSYNWIFRSKESHLFRTT